MTRAGAEQQKSEAPNQLITASQSRVSIPTECGQRFPTALASTAAILRSIPDLPAHPQSSTHHLGWQEAVEPVPPLGIFGYPNDGRSRASWSNSSSGVDQTPGSLKVAGWIRSGEGVLAAQGNFGKQQQPNFPLAITLTNTGP